ncbi:GTP cyclohydrolase II RibA [Candidatus Uabimicrobium amorphum]|uniref:GTP cyclohydrolase II n=1 Tax=Uabimicrobium amorphum TaxID=2596890 RepID=A0A5S9IR57_UABAM|nr:GTP cyclohydrolase II RibA [Candidatus Uabimicrobium amorphum]BBM86384.1 GTP cyclohydrolase-2 [Candidatus Uabimicrobium amorphum]
MNLQRKIAMVTKRRTLPDCLVQSLDCHEYRYEIENNIQDAIRKAYDVFAIDTSVVSTNLKKVRSQIIATNKSSFFTSLDFFDEPNELTKKRLAKFLWQIEADHSINHELYSFFDETTLNTQYGNFMYFGFQSRMSQREVLGVRTLSLPKTPLVRVHSMCYTGDIFHSLRCNCREELENSLKVINEEGGILIYSQQSGRGIGALNKIKVYEHQKKGADTVEAQHLENFPNDLRTYDYLKDVFFHFGITQIKLITSNPTKVVACKNAGVAVVQTVKLLSTINEHNRDYLKTKMEKNHHNFQAEFSMLR